MNKISRFDNFLKVVKSKLKKIITKNIIHNSKFIIHNFLVAYKNSDQNSNLLIFHIYKYFFIYLIFNNITFKMYIQNYK